MDEEMEEAEMEENWVSLALISIDTTDFLNLRDLFKLFEIQKELSFLRWIQPIYMKILIIKFNFLMRY